MTMKKKAAAPSGTRILFDRLYRGKPNRIASLKRTRKELALGRQIRALREARKLSQAQLAKALGTQAPAVSRIEDANYDSHSLRILRKIADYFEQNLIVSFEPKTPSANTARRLERELARA